MDCKNHPGIPAKRKCYNCSNPVCSVCQTRGSGHIFCSEECLKEHTKNQTITGTSRTEELTEVEKLIPGTPHVDAAYFKTETPISIKNINLETFEAIQSIIDRTDKELKAYLKDLELIFESASSESIEKLKDLFEEKWERLGQNLEGFKRQAENTAKELSAFEQNIVKNQTDSSTYLQKLKSAVDQSSQSIDGKLDKVNSDIGSEISKRFSKLVDSLDHMSFSFDESLNNLKDQLSQSRDNLSTQISGVEKKFSTELSDNFKGLRSQLDSKIGSIASSIDVSKENEKELFLKNEESVKNLLGQERKFVDELVSEYSKKLNLNLNANKERIAQTITSGNSEIKDFLDFQRVELYKSVTKIGENLAAIFKTGGKGFSDIGLDIGKRLESNLRENSEELEANLNSFEQGTLDLLSGNKKELEDFLRSMEDENRALLDKFTVNLEDSLRLQKGEFEKTISTQTTSVSDLLENTKSSFENRLKEQTQNFDQSLDKNLSASAAKIEEAFTSNSKKIDEFIEGHKEKISKFVEESFTNEKEELKNLLNLNQSFFSGSIEKLTKDISSSNSTNKDEINSFIKEKITTVESKLASTAKDIEKFNSSAISSASSNLNSSMEAFQAQFKAHLEKRERVLIDEIACLAVASKGNMEDVFNKNRVDIEAQIKNLERESGKLLKTEISKGMDVFNLNLSALLGEIKDNLKKKVQAIPTQFSLSNSIKASIIAIMLLVLVTPAFVYINSRNMAKQFSARVEGTIPKLDKADVKSAPANFVKEEKSQAEAGSIEKPKLLMKDNLLAAHSKISFKGESKFGNFVLLSINGEWKGLKFIGKNYFYFENIDLVPGENRLEITAYSVSGKKSPTETKIVIFNKSSSTSKSYNLAFNITRGDIRKPQVAITFDGGSNTAAAPFILETLKEKGIQTTMFLTGDFIKSNPDLTNQIVADGHEVGNHTYSHPHLVKIVSGKFQQTAVSRKDFEAELNKTRDIFRKTTGKEMAPLWRAPYGEVDDDVLAWAKNLGYTHVRWTAKEGKAMDSLDWVEAEESKLYRTAEEIKEAILGFDDGIKGGSNGSIIIMHLGTNRTSDQPYSKLGDIIDGMRGKGYEFVKVSDLMESYGLKKFVINK